MPGREPGAFVVRILGPGARPVGVGALVGPREIVTCAHVVNAALGLDPRAQNQPAEAVTVDFPLAANPGAVRRGARVVRWLPPPREGAAGDDLAGLVLGEPPPDGTEPARLVVNPPQVGQEVRVFGYPGTPPRPDGAWVTSTVRGRVGGGRLQLDSTDAALRVQPGFSGSPVYDDATERVVGLLTSAAAGRTAERDSYAIASDRLRLAWPEILGSRQPRASQRKGGGPGELTILHVSDTQFGRHHLFGGNGLIPVERDTLFRRLHDDLSGLAGGGLRPDLIVVTGDLAEWGLRSEFDQVTDFLGALCEAAEIPRQHVALVPGNHDVNRKACEAYFAEQESDEREPVPPYWPKWRQFVSAFTRFYADVATATFTPDEPWTLFEMPSLGVVVAGLNSTMAESHRDGDHYGLVGEHQLRWFAERLADYRSRGWLRLAAVHHNVARGAATGEENLRDADDLDRILGQPGLANLLLHGHTHDGRRHRLGSGLAALSTGSAAVDAASRPAEIPSQYQLVTVRRDGFTRHARQYAPGLHRWIGDTRISASGSDWRDAQAYPLDSVHAALPEDKAEPEPAAAGGAAGRAPLGLREDFLDRVGQATQVNFAEATVTLRPEGGYLRVSNPLPGGGAEQWPVGAADGPLTEDVLDAFLSQVHSRFAAADPSVRSEFVYGGPPAPERLLTRARQRGVRVRSFIEYQGLLDLRPLVARQNEQLDNDRVYPAELYVPQRFRVLDGSHDDEIRTGLIEQAITWLSADSARLVMVLGDFGRGKTSFLRQLARTLPAEFPAVLPVLVELRSLEKSPALDELLAQHLVRRGVEDISPAKLRYMINSGRLALLFDGFDELELRVGYDNAAEYLQVLLESVTERAKVILTSRTQHFRSTGQVRTALGERVATVAASRVILLEDFSEEQIRQFLANLYGGDEALARERFDLIGDIEDLLGLARNPRMLAFIAALDEAGLRAVQRREGRISAAELYREIIRFWLAGEAARQQHRRGRPSLDERERLDACTALALRLWASASATIGLPDLSAEVSATLTRLAERGYSSEQASHAIGSGSLLVRTDDGAFAFVHQSIMEWLVADAAAASLTGDAPVAARILTTRQMSRLMIDFFGDLAGPQAALSWAAVVLTDRESSPTAKQNALAIRQRLDTDAEAYAMRSVIEPAPVAASERQNLAGVDLRGLDLTGRDLRDADLHGANLRGMRLEDAGLHRADLRDADLTGARLVRGSLRGARLAGSRWDRAALLGTEVPGEVLEAPELRSAVVAGRDRADLMIAPSLVSAVSVDFSPDGTLLAAAFTSGVAIVDVSDGQVIRHLPGYGSGLTAAAFSPDGTLVATASADGIARILQVATGTTRTRLQGHTGEVNAVAFSPEGTLVATASADRTARIWDVTTGRVVATFAGHTGVLLDVAFSPEGTLVATASTDRTARIWDVASGASATTIKSDEARIRAVAFSPDGTLLASAFDDGSIRIWDLATGTTRTTMQGTSGELHAVAFSPDGTLLAAAARDGSARVWDLATGDTRIALSGYGGYNVVVTDVAFSPDGSLVATAASDLTARIWDLASGASRVIVQGARELLRGVAFAGGGSMLATASDQSVAHLWDLAAGTIRATIDLDGLPGYLAFSPDGRLVAGPAAGGTTEIRDLVTGAVRHAGLPGRVPWTMAFSPDGTLLAIGYLKDSRVDVWDLASETVCATVDTQREGALALAFSPDGAVLATTAADDLVIQLWELTTASAATQITSARATLQGHGGEVTAVAFSPDGIRLASASADGTARIWSATATTASGTASGTGTGQAVLRGHGGTLNAVAFSPDGTRLATTANDGTARIWSVATATANAAGLAVLRGHGGALNAVAFSPDGTRLATSASDGTAQVWDLATGVSEVTLMPLPERGYATVCAAGYKLHGDLGDRLWWAVKLCRFAPGELDAFVPGLRRLRAGDPILRAPAS
jgi:WD40 repeat protein/V8-like Glu-specific endopeptidase